MRDYANSVESNISNLDDSPNSSSQNTSSKFILKKPHSKTDTLEMIEDSSFPISPTDGCWSPTTMKMKLIHRKLSRGEMLEKSDFNLERDITRREFPLSEDCPLILGSSSKNRKQILELSNWPFTVMSPDIDEKAIRSSNYLELPQLIAKAKAEVLIECLKKEKRLNPCVLVTCDQIVLFQNQIREKPVDAQEAFSFLTSYSNNYVTTVSAVVATHYPSLRQSCDIDIAQVYWNEIDYDTVNKVVSRGDIFSSAGGFRIEDPDLNPLIRDIEGSLDSVVGMPIDLTVRLVNIVKDQISYDLNTLKLLVFSYKNTDPEFEDAWRERRPSDSTYYIRRRTVKSWGRSRSGTAESRNSPCRNRAFTGRSDISVLNTDILAPPISVPSSPTDRRLSPVSMKLSQRKSPSVKSLAHRNHLKKREYNLSTDMNRRPYPIDHLIGQLIIGTEKGSYQSQVFDIQNWPYMTITPDVNEKLSIDKLSDSPIKIAEMWAKEQSASVLNKIRNFATPINSAFIVTTNQIVLYEGQMMKYPVNREEAIKWLSSYSSDKVSIVTAVVVTHYPSERQACDTDIAIIHFYDISPDVANSISNRPETLKFIGAISIEDTDLNPLIRHVEGTVDSIAGMPVDVISRLILNVAQEYTPSSPRMFTFRDPVIDSAKSSIRSTVDTTTTQQSSSTSTLTASISIPPTSNTKWLTVICPGKKVPIRSSSSITSHVLRYASSGDKFQIYRQTVSGFYQLCDDKGYINKGMSGVEWIESEHQ